MDKDRFETLVARMERYAIGHPDAYRRRVYAVAALGYAYLLIVIVVLLGLFGATLLSLGALKAFALKLLLVEGALLFAVVRSLWVRQHAPEGQFLTAADAPELFETIREFQRKLQTSDIHAVVVIPDFNAAVTQVPRLGVFGWHKNFLLVGLPLMKGLTVEQFKAVLAHELGHLSRGHARVANWIYRMRMIWTRLESSFARKRHWGAGIILQFFKWYVPYFNAISFPFARANEYEADSTSVKLTSVRDASQALTSVHIIAGYLANSYWPGIRATAKELPEPPRTAYSGFVAEAITEEPADELDRWRNVAMSEITSHADTHPSLSDRLRAMGGQPEFAPPPRAGGADQLLGPALRRIEEALDGQWHDAMSASWREYHSAIQAKRARLSQLRDSPPDSGSNETALLEVAALEEEVGGGESAAAPLLRDILEKFPQSRAAQFSLGRVLLGSGQEEGVALIERVIAEDPTSARAGSALLRDFYRRRGDEAAARQWQDRHVAEAMRLQSEMTERRHIRLKDKFAPNELESEVRSRLVTALKGIKHVRHAYMVRRIDPKRPGEKFYILGVQSTAFFQLHSDKRAKKAIADIQQSVSFPEQTVMLNIDGNMYKFARKMRRVKRAKLF